MPAEVPDISPDVLIIESTYGARNHDPREQREEQFTSKSSIFFSLYSCLLILFYLKKLFILLF